MRIYIDFGLTFIVFLIGAMTFFTWLSMETGHPEYMNRFTIGMLFGLSLATGLKLIGEGIWVGKK